MPDRAFADANLRSRGSDAGSAEPRHDPRPITAAGPAGMFNSYGWCPCGWQGPSRATRDEAQADATSHEQAATGTLDR